MRTSSPLPSPRLSSSSGVRRFASSVGLVLYNKWLVSPCHPGDEMCGAGFPFPVFITMCSFAFCGAAAQCVCLFYGWRLEESLGAWTWTSLFKLTSSVMFFSGADVALTNLAFVYLNANFVEMVKVLGLAAGDSAEGGRAAAVMGEAAAEGGAMEAEEAGEPNRQ